jgi:membrane associated rhomboid family serine protease
MIPIRDQIPTRRVPIVNYLLIAVNVVVFILMWLAGSEQEALVQEFALIPAQVTSGLDLGDITRVFTSMFMHGGLAHIAGNMLYLWIFGDNVEDAMGRGKYLVFYLVGGLVASFTHILTNPGSQIPTVGASGAIAAVLGAYLVLYPSEPRADDHPAGIFYADHTAASQCCAWALVRAATVQRFPFVGWTGCRRRGVLGTYWRIYHGGCAGKVISQAAAARNYGALLIR